MHIGPPTRLCAATPMSLVHSARLVTSRSAQSRRSHYSSLPIPIYADMRLHARFAPPRTVHLPAALPSFHGYRSTQHRFTLQSIPRCPDYLPTAPLLQHAGCPWLHQRNAIPASCSWRWKIPADLMKELWHTIDVEVAGEDSFEVCPGERGARGDRPRGWPAIRGQMRNAGAASMRARLSRQTHTANGTTKRGMSVTLHSQRCTYTTTTSSHAATMAPRRPAALTSLMAIASVSAPDSGSALSATTRLTLLLSLPAV